MRSSRRRSVNLDSSGPQFDSESSSESLNGSRMPINLWRMDRRDVWRTCFCFHVRTVCIFIGVWHLMLYILALSFVAAMVMYDQNNQNDAYLPSTSRPDPILPTPQSKIHNSGLTASLEYPKYESLTIDHRTLDEDSTRARMEGIRNGPWNFIIAEGRNGKANSQMILLTVCNMLITLLMIYGAVRGKPSYLMPFFVLKVFDFCIFCLTMVGFFSYLPDVNQIIINQPGLPFREELLRMDPQLLSLITLILIVATIAFKAYIIGVIWNCYKYLMLRNTVIRGVIAYRHDDPQNIMGMQQNLLPDLPDYETAINDPRYAKKPPMEGSASPAPAPVSSTQSNLGLVAPPPYSVAVQIPSGASSVNEVAVERREEVVERTPERVASEMSTQTIEEPKEVLPSETESKTTESTTTTDDGPMK